jgi:hypothetical protein
VAVHPSANAIHSDSRPLSEQIPIEVTVSRVIAREVQLHRGRGEGRGHFCRGGGSCRASSRYRPCSAYV